MDMQNVIYAVAVLFIMGIVFAILLGVAAKVFAVEVDERVPLVRECLPGANCGGCGFPGCDGLAAAIVEGRAPVNGCPVGGAAAAEKIAKVLGVEVAAGDRQVAHVYCNGGCNAKDKANYEGLQDCNAAMRVASGPKACSFGCMGLGSCVKACAFDAIHIVDGVAKVDTDKCVACGKCVSTCPKKIINLVSEVKKVHVNCVNKDKGPEVMKVCSNGCIGCKICVKACPKEGARCAPRHARRAASSRFRPRKRRPSSRKCRLSRLLLPRLRLRLQSRPLKQRLLRTSNDRSSAPCAG